VVDSVTLTGLQGVHVGIKHSKGGAVTNSSGVFTITTSPSDTIVLSLIGYNTIEVPLLFEEESILIRMSERIRMLKEITISSTRLYDKEIVRTPSRQPHAMRTSEAFSSPWTYLSRGEREKRKAVRLINENDRIRTYIQVIHDVEIRESIMYSHELTELEYYNTLAKFNQQSSDVLYSTDPHVIESSMRSFFNRMHP